MPTPAGPLYPTVVHSSIQAGLIPTGLAPGTLHFHAVYFGDVDIARIIIFADIRFGRVKRYRPFEEIFAPETQILEYRKQK